MVLYAPVDVEDELLLRLEAQRQRDERLSAQAREPVAEAVARHRQQAPWMSGGTSLALGEGRVNPDAPTARLAAKGEAKKKKHKGIGWHTIGEVTRAAGRGSDRLLGGVDEAASKVAKPIVRTGALVAQSAYEEAQGVVRNVAAISPEAAGAAVGAGLGSIVPGAGTAAGAVVGGAIGGGLGHLARDEVKGDPKWEFQSSGAEALKRAVTGKRVDLGHGFLPNVADTNQNDPQRPIGDIQRERARNVTIGGRSLTPGRLLATGVFEPGTGAWNTASGLVDMSVALSRFDPSSAALKGAGRAAKVARGDELIAVGAVEGRMKQVFAKTADQWLASERGQKVVEKLVATDSFDEVWRASGKQFDVDTAVKLADAKTAEDVVKILKPQLGVELREAPKLRTFRPFDTVRLAHAMPGHTIDLHDKGQAVETLDRWMANARLAPEAIARFTDRMARSRSKIGRMEVLEDVLDATKQVLTDAWGVNPNRATKLTRMVDDVEGLRLYFVNAAGESQKIPGAIVDGKTLPTPSPHLYAEYLNRALPLPDARDIRRVTSEWKPIFDNPAVKFGTAVLDVAQGQIWKRMALLRGAYTVRVVGEEQARMAAAGLDSAFNHPLSFLSWRLGRGSDVLGKDFVYKEADELAEGLDEFNKSLNRQWAGWIDEKIPTRAWRPVQKGSPEYVNAWARELMQLSSDPIARRVAAGDDLHEIKQWFYNGAGQKIRKDLAEQLPELTDPRVADAYVDSIAERINIKAGGMRDVVAALASGKYADAPIRSGLRPSKEFLAALEEGVDFGPAVVKGEHAIGVGSEARKQMDNAVRWMFSNLMSERTNNLSRSPAFRQHYWQRIEELAPALTKEARAEAIKAAELAGLPKDTIKRLRAVTGSGELKLTHADTVAKGHALDKTRELLYDMTEKSQFFDAARLVTPFGEAWREMVTRWTKIGVENPAVFRRAQQVVTGLRNADPDGDGRGFFYKNEKGEEVFAYPGAGWISEKLLGVPIPLTGRAAGLSLMTEVMPGVGPVVQIPAGALLPDAPEWDHMRSVIFPFGEQDTSEGFVESFLPAWAQKWRNSGLSPFGRDEGLWDATVVDVERFLASTGKYDTSTVEGMQELHDAATSKAQGVFAIRSAAQFFAPSAPIPEWVVKDKTGKSHVAQKLLNEYYDARVADGDAAAFRGMLDKYGENIFLLLQAKTAAVTPGAPMSKEGSDWERKNPDIAKRYPEVYGYFAPQGEIDSAAFARLLESGKRYRLEPDQGLRLANDKLARTIYEEARSKVGPKPSEQGKAWLRQLHEALVEDYPGYEQRVGIPQKADTEDLIRQLTEAVDDKRLANEPVTAAMKKYLIARDKAKQISEASGLQPGSFATAKRMANVRSWLREVGETLSEEEPAFDQAWTYVFSRELKEDDKELQAA